MSTISEDPFSRRDENHPITLIPVGLKEAALDSPTFRSGFTHFSEQLDYLEKWLENYVRSTTKLSSEIGTFEGLINGYLNAVSSPPNLSEAVVDHDYTLLAMRRYGEGARDFWATTISGLKKMDVNMVEPIRAFLQNDFRTFKDARRNLEQSQKQLDSLQARYSAQTKSKEPSALREDAFQLHEARKSCLKASMDFGVIGPSLRVALDKMLVKMFSDQWRDMRNARENMSGSVGRLGTDIERVRGWSRELENGEKMFRRELQNARKQIEESAEIAARPSRDLEEYSAVSGSAIGVNRQSMKNRRSPNRQGTGGLEIQGWLNLRTVTGKPTRIIWLRRWFYVKNGIFGWLVQGPRSGGVEESERTGVLLCSVRLANLEDRRFCFEVKTKDTTTVVQAETQTELLGWIEAFENAKQKALEDPSSRDSPGLAGPRAAEAAFAILPPSVPEFAASGTDFSMQQLADDNSNAPFDRSATLPVPGGDSGLNIANRHSFDVSTHRRSTPNDREGESGKDHASRIIQKLDLHRKSTSSPQVGGFPASPLPPSQTLPGGGIASLIAASHSSIPGGPGMLPQPPPIEHPAARVRSPTTIRDLPLSTLAPITLINPPAPTNLSSVAVVVNRERGISNGRIDPSGSLPSGIMANIWGSSNWGYLNSLEREKLQLSRSHQAQPDDSHTTTARMVSHSARATDSGETVQSRLEIPTSLPPHRPDVGLEKDNMISQPSTTIQQGYPSYYPSQLKVQCAQFQLLFPDVAPEEKPVLVFRATWNLDNDREFPGRVYVTAKKMYFYSNHLGLVLISEMSLSLISEVTAAPGRDCDFLFVQLKARDEINGPTRITIKTFLEPLKLLQRRLNFLVQNCSNYQVLGLESVLKSLIKIEQDDPASSPSLESWEEVSVNTPFDDGSLLSRHASQRNPRDLRARVLVDGRLYGGASKTDESKENAKIKLPGQPVSHVPTGMDKIAIEKIFDISPKALFHVMFGDRSAVWQLLYHGRQAQRIRQGSWTQLKHGHQRREFEYQVEQHDIFRRQFRTKVVDSQMIDVSNDHLCYVVTDRKTPWHLPYSQDFQLLNLVTRRALDDLELDALDLADAITDQVGKLGAQSRTKKAIQIFGLVGQQTQVSEFAGSVLPLISQPRRTMRYCTLTGLLLRSFASIIGSCMSSLLIRALTFVRWTWKTFNANSILLGVLLVSVITNLIFSSSSTSEWWRERKAGNFMARMGVGPNLSMSKAIYLHELNNAAIGEAGAVDLTENTCHATFARIVSIIDMDAPSRSAAAWPLGINDKATARRLRRTRQQMGSHRHDLLVAQRVVNSIEREMVQAEWEHWLAGEQRKCHELGIMMREHRTEAFEAAAAEQPDDQHDDNRTADDGQHEQRDGERLRSWYQSYCESCSPERIRQLGTDGGGAGGASERTWSLL
ncbi:SNF1-interacting protein [Pseudocyphellaria aurata]|nr:SNF1-interacting protein [Pseudocyphellaria aurata]